MTTPYDSNPTYDYNRDALCNHTATQLRKRLALGHPLRFGDHPSFVDSPFTRQCISDRLTYIASKA